MSNSNHFPQLAFYSHFGPQPQIYTDQNSPNFYNRFNYQVYPSNLPIQSSIQPLSQHKFMYLPLTGNPSQYQNFHNIPIDSRMEHNVFSTPFVQPPQIESDRTKKNRRDRTTYTKFQKDTLEKYFNLNAYPDVAVREKVSKELRISELNIQVWFKNRRAKRKRQLTITERDQSTPNTEGSMINTSDRSNLNSSDEGKEIVYNSKDLRIISPELTIKQENENLYMSHINNANENNFMTTENYDIHSRFNFPQNQLYSFNLPENSYLHQLNAYRPETI